MFYISRLLYYIFFVKKGTPFGNEFNMVYSVSIFVGCRFSIFNYATKETGGYVDVDWFSTEEQFSEELFYDDSFPGYTEEEITVDEIYTDDEVINVLLGTSQTLKLKARFLDGHIEDISTKATYSLSSDNVISIINAQLISLAEGSVTVTAEFEDLLGNRKSTSFQVKVQLFPLITGLFNPSIFNTGTFDETTGMVATGENGAAGWVYSNGIDISSYKYLVFELAEIQTSWAALRLYDENNYWTSPASYSFDDNTRLVVSLDSMTKEDGSVCDSSHIYIICIWSNGSSPIYIKDVYLTSSDD